MRPPAARVCPTAALLALQRLAGNRAVTAMVRGSALVVQRDDPKPTSKQGRWLTEFRRDHPRLEGVGAVHGTRGEPVMTPTGIRVPAVKGDLLPPRPFYERRMAAFLAYQGFIHYAELVEVGHDAAATNIALALMQKTGRQVPNDLEMDLAAYTRWSQRAVAARQTVEFGLLAAEVVAAWRALRGGLAALRDRMARTPFRGPGAAHLHDEAFAANRMYKGPGSGVKHTGKSRKVGGRTVSAEPKNGQRALDDSFPLDPSGKRTRRRIGVDLDNQQIVVLDRTGNLVQGKKVVGGEYHGHVRTWDELSADMKKLLENRGFKVEGGKLKGPTGWDEL